MKIQFKVQLPKSGFSMASEHPLWSQKIQESAHGIVDKVLDCDLYVSEFEV